MKSLIIFILIIMAFPSCKSQKENSKFVDLPSQPNKSRRPMIIGGGSVTMRAPAIIYKTSEDFYNKVPVTLNASKTAIVSYPAPSDLRRGDSFAYPTRLHNGYFLDNRGINTNTAFTDFTYEEYAAMSEAPSTETLLQHIISTDPFTEIYKTNAPRDSQNGTDFYNDIVKSGFTDCQRVK